MSEASVKQTSQIQQWLDLAPNPPTLDGKQWHVFLSYRSVNRNWVLNLYDALRAVGFEVFLDQLEIAVGDSLPRRLNNALSRSQTGIIVWSARYDDSEWCQSEYEAMEAMRKGSEFRFVIVKLDPGKLPPFAAKDVYVDFSAYPAGPQGGELIKLMYGLLGQPASKDVLLRAQAIDDQTRRTIAKIAASRDQGSAQSLVKLARDGGEVWQASPFLYSAAAEALIEMEQYDLAIDILQSTQQFENAIRPVQLRALACARKAKLLFARASDENLSQEERATAREMQDALLSDAQQSLGELYRLGHRDPETLGIYARTWMDRYNLTRKRAFLEKSRNLYALAFELDSADSYTGINAATKSVLLGEFEHGAKIAAAVEKLVGARPIAGDYWKTATVAEVQLLRRNYERAAEIYRSAVADTPLATANHASSRDQAKLILDALNAPAESREKVLTAFDA